MWVDGGEDLLNVPHLLDRLRVKYVLGYYPTNPRQDKKARKITLNVSPLAKKRYGDIRLSYRRRYYPGMNEANQFP